jgi:SAM-dependent methyltransferase
MNLKDSKIYRAYQIHKSVNSITITKEDLEYLTSLVPSSGDDFAKNLPYGYTADLSDSRAMRIVNSERNGLPTFSGSLRDHLSPHISDTILEIGPGVNDDLYGIMQMRDVDWTSLDISPAVIIEITETYGGRKGYHIVEGSIREIPLQNEKYDTVCGLCSLDAVLDFDTVSQEIGRVLKPKGKLIHVQDYEPSSLTIAFLLLNDPEFQKTGHVIANYSHNFDPNNDQMEILKNLLLIEIPGQEPISPREYLHQGLERVFNKKGFETEERGLKIVGKDLDNPYAYLIMNKSAN